MIAVIMFYCHCGKQAVVRVPSGPPLCMQCWGIFQEKLQENQRLAFSFINFLQDEMAFVAGVPSMGPKLQVPQPTFIKTHQLL